MGRSRRRELPEDWSLAIADALRSEDPTLVGAAASAVRELVGEPDKRNEKLRNLVDLLKTVAIDEQLSPETRSQALAAVAHQLDPFPTAAFHFLCQNISPDQPVSLRADSAGALSPRTARPAATAGSDRSL